MSNVDIRTFDRAYMRSNATMLMLGTRGTGKSTLINDIMYHNRDKFHFGVGMSPTDDTTRALGSILPHSCVFDEFNEEGVRRMLEYQKRAGKLARTGDAANFKNMFCILDDCAYDSKTLRSKTMREVFMNGRHRNIFMVNAIQYMMDVPSFLRGQIDYVFATRDNIIDQREKLWKYFFGMFPDYRNFSRVLDACTTGYDVIVMDTTVRSNKIEDMVYWYSANPDLPPFRLCADVFWDLDAYYIAGENDKANDKHQDAQVGGDLVINKLKRN